MQGDLKRSAISGLSWKYAERIMAQLISTVVSIIIARMLEPSHYGLIAIVNVFISLCNVFVVTGLGESLVQKYDADELDFSSIFYVNILLSVILYIILYFCAPQISLFYGAEYPELTRIIRVMGIRLIFAATNSIQSAKVSRDMAFKKYFWVTLFGTLISAIVGITMAYNHLGVWALVAQYMTNSIIDTFMLFAFVQWFPKRIFSFERVKPLFRYGWKILFAALITTIYNELRNLLIGKRYTAEDLAFYSKGNTYPKLLVNNLNSAISSVLFPVFSKVQNDPIAIKRILQRTIKVSSYILFPTMIGLALISNSFIELLLTTKWLPCVPYLQMMCFIYAIMPISMANLQCLTSMGYSSQYVKVSVFKRCVSIVILMAVFNINVFWVAMSQVFSTLFDYIVDASIVGSKIQYKVTEQFKDMLPNVLITLSMGVCVFVLGQVLAGLSCFMLLITQIVIGALVYLILSIVTHNSTFYYVLNTAKQFLNKKENRN